MQIIERKDQNGLISYDILNLLKFLLTSLGKSNWRNQTSWGITSLYITYLNLTLEVKFIFS